MNDRRSGSRSASKAFAKFWTSLMLWPFNRPKTPSGPSRSTIEAIYGMIVAQARLPVFYSAYGVPDTVNGRFDMVVLHLWLVLRRIPGTAVAQGLFDWFCSDMDANLREMGVGDITVPRRMHKYAESFYGRMGAYDTALAEGGDSLAQALARNVMVGAEPSTAMPLAGYVEAAIRALDECDPTQLQSGVWSFATPVPVANNPPPQEAS
jgi:cytochrome b pre-mRNA-processing protein 3